MKTMQTYTGVDATLEILIMLFGAFLLGVLLMWLYDEFLTECVDNIDSGKKESVDLEKVVKIDTKFNNSKNKELYVENKEHREDDLKIIEGVGPKIESLLKEAGIMTLDAVSKATPDQIRDILRDKGGERYAFHDPSTWPDQAKLAYDGRMEELQEYQDFLSGGKA